MNHILQSLVSATARAVATRAASILASFLLTIIVARLLGAESAGSYFLVFTSITILATFGRFGTDNLALKICGGDTSNIRTDLGHSALLAGIASTAGVAAVYGAVRLTDYSLPGVSAGWTLTVIAAAIPQAFTVLAGAVLRARDFMAVGITAELGSIPVLSMAFILAGNALGIADLTMALLSLVAASWLTAMWSVPAAIASLRGEPKGQRTNWFAGFGDYLRSRIRQLTSMMGTSLLFYILTWSPLYALSIMSTLANVAYFTVAARVANVVSLVPTLQVAYLAPAFARLFHQGKLKELNALCGRAVRQAAAFLIVPVLVLTIGAVPIVTLLYGTQFRPAAWPLAILTLGGLLVVLIGQVNQLMLLCNLESHALVLNIILITLWVTAGLWASLQFGAIGASVFSVTVSILYAGAAARLLRTRRGIRSYFSFSASWNRDEPTQTHL